MVDPGSRLLETQLLSPVVLKVKSQFRHQASVALEDWPLWLYLLTHAVVTCILAEQDHTKLWKLAVAPKSQQMLYFPTWNPSSPTAPSTGYVLFILRVLA